MQPLAVDVARPSRQREAVVVAVVADAAVVVAAAVVAVTNLVLETKKGWLNRASPF